MMTMMMLVMMTIMVIMILTLTWNFNRKAIEYQSNDEVGLVKTSQKISSALSLQSSPASAIIPILEHVTILVISIISGRQHDNEHCRQ